MEKLSISLVLLQSLLIGVIFACTPILEAFTSSPLLARKASHILAPHVLLLYAYLRRNQEINPLEAVLPWAIIAGVLLLTVLTSILHERVFSTDRNVLFQKLDKYMLRYKNTPLPALAYMLGMAYMAWIYKKNPYSSLIGTMALAWGDGLSSLLTSNIKNIHWQFIAHTSIT